MTWTLVLCQVSLAMKLSMELAISGIQGIQLQRKGHSSYRVKASTSYVDETLFGSPVGTQPTVLEFDPPWADKDSPRSPQTAGIRWKTEAGPSKACTLANTPRKRNKYRLKSHTPSYCDETLFGSKPEEPGWVASWMKKEDTAKLCPLLWTPSPVPRSQSSLSSHPKESPLRVVHPQAPESQALADFETEYRGKTYFWKWPENDSDSASQGTLNWGHSQSLTPLHSPSDRLRPSAANPRTSRHTNSCFPTASVTSQDPLARVRSKSVSGSSSARVSRATGLYKPNSPWK